LFQSKEKNSYNYKTTSQKLPILVVATAIIESLSSTSDTNTDTNNMSRACSLLARSKRTSVLEVTTTEVGLVLEVGGIVR
jgi:predicted RNA-binding protein with PUA-like domain